MNERAVVAFIGEAGWWEEGRSGPNTTFTRSGGLQESELTAPIRVDLRPAIEAAANPVAAIFKRPSLNLGLADNYVRNLFEGAEGSTDGHPWDGDLASLRGSDSVGLDVYLAVLAAQGAVITRV